jgi:excisionase family DNA binding protein
MEQYMSVGEAARVLEMHPQTIYRMVWDGKLTGVIRLGRSIRIPAAALRDLPGYVRPSERGGSG